MNHIAAGVSAGSGPGGGGLKSALAASGNPGTTSTDNKAFVGEPAHALERPERIAEMEKQTADDRDVEASQGTRNVVHVSIRGASP